MGQKKRKENISESTNRKHNSQRDQKVKYNKQVLKERSAPKTKMSVSYFLVLFSLAAVCGILHRYHIAGMFERDRHFSHLSTLERDLAFRTEMGLYYSYYKTIIEAPTFMEGMYRIMYDNVTEYPDTINTLKRFNLYPEMAVGAAYRMFEQTTKSLNIKTRECWRTNRGKDLPPIISCEGLGDPHYFYIECVFLLNGINMAVFFLFGTYLSGSIAGGVLSVSSFFFNHGECTRVQWTPPLRESFAYPFVVMEMFIVTFVLKTQRPNFRHSLLIALAAILFTLPWQFAQFALMTQAMAVFATYILQFIGSHKLRIVIYGQALGLLVSYVCLFGNEMLLTSYYAACLLTISIIVSLESVIEKLRVRPVIWVVQGVMLLLGTVAVKYAASKILRVTDDAHIGEILASKFSDFKNFHTMLYTCAAEFDFLELETYWKLIKSCLLPCALACVFAALYKILKDEINMVLERWNMNDQDPAHNNGNVVHNDRGDVIHNNNVDANLDIDAKYRSKPNAEVVYHLLQLCAFTIMAVLIMRLKLFWTPHLCLMTSLLASREFFGWLGERSRQYTLVFVVLGAMSIAGYANLMHQFRIQGEFSNYPQEQLVNWINDKTPKNAVFAGPMPTMATVKLCTSRPIVNHPHYEDANLRARTKKVYSMYSRKPVNEIWQNLMDLKVDYAILEMSWCQRRSRPGCSMAEIWDLEDEANRGKQTPTCAELYQKQEPYFKSSFKNNVYTVLEVLKKPQLS